MYKISISNAGSEKSIYIPGSNLTLIAATLDLELNRAGRLQITMPHDHPYWSDIHSLTTDFLVYQNDEIIWRGRMISDERDFYLSGSLICEGELSFLFDSLYRPFNFKGSVNDFLTLLINNHNSQVEDRKKFVLGTITVMDTNNSITRRSESAVRTLELISTRLLETHAGYLKIRYEGNVRYLDYLIDYNHQSTQRIEFAKNLIDLTQFFDATKIRTALLPYGAEIEGAATGERVTIKTVNNNVDYIYDQEAVNAFGWIWETITFDDVTRPDNLLTKARTALSEMLYSSLSINLSAVDLSILGGQYEKIRIGDWVKVISKPHSLDKYFLVSQLSINILSPESSTISLGSVIPTLTAASSSSMQATSQTADSTSARILRATQLITGQLGGHVVLDPPERPERILIMSSPEKETATNLWQWSLGGLGFSRNGINGPYPVAITMDGAINADFVTTGSLQADIVAIGGTENGTLNIRNAAGDVIGRIDERGLLINNTIANNATVFKATDQEYGLFNATNSKMLIGAKVINGKLMGMSKYVVDDLESAYIAIGYFSPPVGDPLPGIVLSGKDLSGALTELGRIGGWVTADKTRGELIIQSGDGTYITLGQNNLILKNKTGQTLWSAR